MLKGSSDITPEVGSFQDYVTQEMNSTKEYIKRNVREEKVTFAMSERDLEMLNYSAGSEHYMEKRTMEAAYELMRGLMGRGVVKVKKYRDHNGDLISTVILNVCRDPEELIDEVESMMEGLEQVYEEL